MQRAYVNAVANLFTRREEEDMNAQELTERMYKKEKELSDLRVKVNELQDTVARLQLAVEDLAHLEGAVDLLTKRLTYIERR